MSTPSTAPVPSAEVDLLEEGLMADPLPAAEEDPEAVTRWGGDNRTFDEEVALREIHHHVEMGLLHAVELGKRLLWAKGSLPYGTFGSWCKKHLKLSQPTIHRHMEIARFFRRQPHLLQPLARASLRQALLIASVPEEELAALTDDGTVAGISFEQLGKLSYAELEKTLRKARREAAVATAQAKATQRENQALTTQLEAHKLRLTEVMGVAPKEAAAIDKLVGDTWARFEAAWDELGWNLDELARRAIECAPKQRAAIRGLYEAMHARAELEYLRSLDLGGVAVTGAEWREALTRADAVGNAFPFPPGRRPLDVEER